MFYQQPIQGLIKVTGIEGARAYQLPPNSSMPMFDATQDIMYVKTTDGGGYPTIRSFSFTPIEPAPISTDGVSRKEFDELKEMILNVQQSIQPKEN